MLLYLFDQHNLLIHFSNVSVLPAPSFLPLLIVIIGVNQGSQVASQVVLVIKNLPANAGDTRDTGSIPGSDRSPGEGIQS